MSVTRRNHIRAGTTYAPGPHTRAGTTYAPEHDPDLHLVLVGCRHILGHPVIHSVRTLSSCYQMVEYLLPSTEYGAAGKFIKTLRSKHDPPPVLIAPLAKNDGYKNLCCAQNAALYARNNGGVPLKGFKLWTLPYVAVGMKTGYIGQVHIVVKMENGAYIDPTPPEVGDENKKMIFVPSSLIYPGVTALEIARLHSRGLEPRMGAVCSDFALLFRQQSSGNQLNAPSPAKLPLWLAPALVAITDITEDELRKMGAHLYKDRFLIEADKLLPAIKWVSGEAN